MFVFLFYTEDVMMATNTRELVNKTKVKTKLHQHTVATKLRTRLNPKRSRSCVCSCTREALKKGPMIGSYSSMAHLFSGTAMGTLSGTFRCGALVAVHAAALLWRRCGGDARAGVEGERPRRRRARGEALTLGRHRGRWRGAWQRWRRQRWRRRRRLGIVLAIAAAAITVLVGGGQALDPSESGLW